MQDTLPTDLVDELEKSYLQQPANQRKSRLFEAGHMKLLVLHLIQKNPKHGYEIIKEISEIVGGNYSPSAGTIYPTLNYLEEMQYILAQSTVDERKKYSITATGIAHLSSQENIIQLIFERLETRHKIHNNPQFIDICRAMENLKTALRLKLKKSPVDADHIEKIAEAIDQAAVKISRL